MIKREKRRRQLAVELLWLFAVCFVLALAVYFFLSFLGMALVDEYSNSLLHPITEDERYDLDRIVFSVSLIASAGFFSVLFFALFGERIAYIRTIIQGVDALRQGNYAQRLPLEGNNELTQLAETINFLSVTEEEIKEKERRLKEEREELIRTLSHDIRTPLTSILSYSELLTAKKDCTSDEYEEYVAMVCRKAKQIQDLTDILLDGGKREVEHFENARLLMEQLAAEFEDVLESTHTVSTDLSHCPAFSGRFDVGEMRRIFDNLISNVQKYADPAEPVTFSIGHDGCGIQICQSNHVKKPKSTATSYRMGLNSIRRIAQNYGGSVAVEETDSVFTITVSLSEIL
ncbi:MAG: HAMP domain-containing histidine kinase [Clostridia bacterium]|nr:HAMP domain-containing histidine kinase [Clostridia bacterium]